MFPLCSTDHIGALPQAPEPAPPVVAAKRTPPMGSWSAGGLAGSKLTADVAFEPRQERLCVRPQHDSPDAVAIAGAPQGNAPAAPAAPSYSSQRQQAASPPIRPSNAADEDGWTKVC